MNVKETVVIEFDKKEADALNYTSCILTKLVGQMEEHNKEFISDSDNFGYGREDIAHTEEILNFLLTDGQFTID